MVFIRSAMIRSPYNRSPSVVANTRPNQHRLRIGMRHMRCRLGMAAGHPWGEGTWPRRSGVPQDRQVPFPQISFQMNGLPVITIYGLINSSWSAHVLLARSCERPGDNSIWPLAWNSIGSRHMKSGERIAPSTRAAYLPPTVADRRWLALRYPFHIENNARGCLLINECSALSFPVIERGGHMGERLAQLIGFRHFSLRLSINWDCGQVRPPVTGIGTERAESNWLDHYLNCSLPLPSLRAPPVMSQIVQSFARLFFASF